jgi:tRNA (cytidine/uridine-2'-O-)-methyltransferase
MSADYEPLLHVVLHQPEIPYNTGSVGRTCVAVGAKLWLVRPLGFRVDDYYLRRAGLDYWEHLNWQVVENWDELTTHLSQASIWLFTKKAQRSYLDVAYARGDVLVFGSESAGLPDSLIAQHPQAQLRIPTMSAASTCRTPWR